MVNSNRHDARQTSPAAERNLSPILDALRGLLPPAGRVLEIASGPGQHVAAFAAAMPAIEWLPSDVEPRALASIRSWAAHAGADNVAEPRVIDVAGAAWERGLDGGFDAVVAINLLHIAPWAVTLGLLDGVARVLDERGQLLIYGPFMRGGQHTAPSNAAFDGSLRARDPAWGVRDVDAIEAAALACGMTVAEVLAMPSNNLLLVCRRVAPAPLTPPARR